MPHRKSKITKLFETTFITLFALTCNSSIAASQQAQPQISTDYRIAPTDAIVVFVKNAPELSGAFRIKSDGTFDMPTIGRLNVQNKTTTEVANLIEKRLRANHIRTLDVKVSVKHINSKSYFIQGAVHKPGIYQIEHPVSLLELVNAAGGLNQTYGSTAFIVRAIESKEGTSKENDDIKYEVIKADLSNLSGGLKVDLPLKPGDVVNIPLKDSEFVRK